MTQAQLTALQGILFFIAFTVGDALLKGVTVPLMRVGARRNDPSVVAGLFAVCFCAGNAAIAYVTGILPTLWTLSNALVANLAICGLLAALLLLTLFTALTGGLSSKVGPVVNLAMVPVLIASHFFFGTRLGLWRMCCILLILLGTVLILSRSQSIRGQVWFVYTLLAMLFYAGLTLLKTILIPETVDDAIYHTVISAIASLTLWVFVFARGKQRTMRDMRPSAWICTPLAALAYAGSFACGHYASLYGELSQLAPLTLLGFASMLLFSRIIARERQPLSVFFGALLTLMGMFAILMGW